MKNPSEHLVKWRKFYAMSCKKHDGGYEKMPTGCYCETAAQIATYIECVIPEEYQKYELDDFTGMKDGRRVVKTEIVLAAKEQLVSYCWEGIDPDEIGNYDFKAWWPKSAMEKRRKNGNSLLIYGDPWSSTIQQGQVKAFKNPIGRTLLAAIVMKEAIRLRARPGHMTDSYAWVSYNRLYDKLMHRAKDDETFNDEINTYETADWLCVDGFEIEKQNDATRMFKAKVLDSFFDERLKMGLPNVFVFQDDLSKDYDLRSEFGLSVNSIINSNKTTRVKLLDSKEVK